jgi:serine/threonine protein kinase
MASDSVPTRGPRKVVRLGKYEVVSHIATGGMGAVYRARDTELNRDLALKVLNREMAGKPAMLERFKREAKAAGKLRHENIVEVYDFDEHNGTWLLAMEFVDGIDLHEYVKRKGPLDPEEARQIVLQGARALRHAHDKNITHRDIKPSNFLITQRRGRPLVKLTDLGLARDTDADQYRVTRDGTTVGTLDYMAPEQARDSGIADIRSDLYALGGTWFHLLAGRAPFPDGGLAERLYKLMNQDPPDVREINPRVSAETWAILDRLLEKEPEDRYQTPAELIDDLLSLKGRAAARPRRQEDREGQRSKRRRGKPDSTADTKSDVAPRTRTSAARRESPPARSRHALWAAAAGGAAFFLVAGAVLLALALRDRHRQPTPREPEGQVTQPSYPPAGRPGDTVRAPDLPGTNPPRDRDKPPPDRGKKPPDPVVPVRARLPALYTPEVAVGPDLRKKAEAPWFSVAGKHRDGVTLVRLRGERAGGARCRLTRCYSRGASLTALDVDAPGAEVLFDGCLLTGGEQPLLRVRANATRGANLRAVRSTLVCTRTFLEVKPAGPLDRSPVVRWLGWDALLSRSGRHPGGKLLTVLDGADTQNMEWAAFNCLYAGWQTLLSAHRSVGADGLRDWRRHWKRIEGEGVARDPWPDQAFNEPATLPASTYDPTRPVRYASTVDPTRPLGCDLAALPQGRGEGWLSIYEPTVNPPEAPGDPSAPEVPAPEDGLYYGETLDLGEVDLGAHLLQVQKAQKLGPRVVLRLTGKGERPTSPLRVKGSSLVLYFTPPEKEEDAPLALSLANAGGVSDPAALVEVDGGSLEIIGGTLRAPDLPGPRIPHLLKVRGGELRLFRCRLEGPTQAVPGNYRGLISLGGSGETAADKARGCAINESVLVSGRAGVSLHGIGARLLLRQSLVVAGTDALEVTLCCSRGRPCRAACCCGRASATPWTGGCTTSRRRASGCPTSPRHWRVGADFGGLPGCAISGRT